MPVNLYIIAVTVVGAAFPAWYFYQIGSRKKQWLRYKVKRTLYALVAYLITALALVKQGGLPPYQIIALSVLVGCGAQWLLVPPPRRNRRISKSVRREVIARDLESKGLQWNSTKYHFDHVVPFSKGGDNSARNLRIISKEKNLSKGDKMPGVRELLR